MEKRDISENSGIQVPIIYDTLRRHLIFHKPAKSAGKL